MTHCSAYCYFSSFGTIQWRRKSQSLLSHILSIRARGRGQVSGFCIQRTAAFYFADSWLFFYCSGKPNRFECSLFLSHNKADSRLSHLGSLLTGEITDTRLVQSMIWFQTSLGSPQLHPLSVFCVSGWGQNDVHDSSFWNFQRCSEPEWVLSSSSPPATTHTHRAPLSPASSQKLLSDGVYPLNIDFWLQSPVTG